jgi:hypothetical protein
VPETVETDGPLAYPALEYRPSLDGVRALAVLVGIAAWDAADEALGFGYKLAARAAVGQSRSDQSTSVPATNE